MAWNLDTSVLTVGLLCIPGQSLESNYLTERADTVNRLRVDGVSRRCLLYIRQYGGSAPSLHCCDENSENDGTCHSSPAVRYLMTLEPTAAVVIFDTLLLYSIRGRKVFAWLCLAQDFFCSQLTIFCSQPAYCSQLTTNLRNCVSAYIIQCVVALLLVGNFGRKHSINARKWPYATRYNFDSL
eukprot:scaffold165757_cov48-Prasinocladus_malaysianus.AAC.1